MKSAIGFVLLGLVVACDAAAPPEVRGTWLTTTANNALRTPAETADTMHRLREIGLNTVYIECWKNGFTEFPSATMQKLIGVPMQINAAPAERQRDLLAEAVTEAHRNGLLAIAWFEYGFMASNASTHNPLRQLGEKEGWLLRNAQGDLISPTDHFVWMNPLHPDAQQILTDIVLEAVHGYDLDGVQLDDRIAMPVEMGYDPYTRDLFASEHHGSPPPANASDPEWIAWRAARLTQFAKRFTTAVHAANPKLLVSLSPAPSPWSYTHYACDWPAWMQWPAAAAWDECIPQNYRLDFDRTRQSIEEGFEPIGKRRADLLAGIRIVGDGPDLSFDDLARTIRFAREKGLGGHVMWFSRGVLDLYPKQLQAFYNVAGEGFAAHPKRPDDWRPPPLVAEQIEPGNWSTNLAHEANYQPIVQSHGQWRSLPSRILPEGRASLRVDDVDAVELLVDRRP